MQSPNVLDHFRQPDPVVRKHSRWNLYVGILSSLIVVLLAVWNLPIARAESGGSTPNVQNGYPADRQTTAYRTGIAAVDTTNVATARTTLAAASKSFMLNLRQNVSVSGRGTNASATIGVRLLYVYRATPGDASTETILGLSPEVTLTAHASLNNGTRYFADNVVFDGMGANVVYVLCTTAPSAGTFDLWVGSY